MTIDSIKRYTVSGDIAYPIHEDPEGDYVSYEDHVAAIEADRQRRGEPVAYRKLEYEDGELIDVEYNGIDQFSFGRKNGEPLITTTQAESYANARVRAALEEAAVVAERSFCDCCCSDDQKFTAEDAAQSIRALIPKEPPCGT